MSSLAQAFIAHLSTLAESERGGMAMLRRSLTFDPGAFPAAYPYVERFVGQNRRADDPYRRALYLTAGLFALHPEHTGKVSFAAAFGCLARERGSGSIEQRFVTLLSAEPESLPNLLRQSVSLLAADGLGFDYVRLLDDLTRWLNVFGQELRDNLRQQWARDFYRACDASPGGAEDASATELNPSGGQTS